MEVIPEKVQSFFNALAPGWDAEREVREEVLEDILDRAGIVPGCRVLDVACGTGVLLPYYLRRDAAHVTGVDLSPEMIRLAAEKHRDPRISLLAGDAQTMELDVYDCIVILNALPHFLDPEALTARLARHLVPGGRLTIAHDRPRQVINSHHDRTASQVSRGLPPAEDTAAWMRTCLRVDTVLEDGEKYVVSGTRPEDGQTIKEVLL